VAIIAKNFWNNTLDPGAENAVNTEHAGKWNEKNKWTRTLETSNLGFRFHRSHHKIPDFSMQLSPFWGDEAPTYITVTMSSFTKPRC
jgi:hypothetical protein